MPRIIGWTWDADIHCNDCTPEDLETDSEGNAVHPVFDTDEVADPVCGTCGEPLE